MFLYAVICMPCMDGKVEKDTDVTIICVLYISVVYVITKC